MLRLISEFVTYKILNITAGSSIGATVDFFIYDSIKLLALLFAMISVIGFLRSYIPQHKIKDWISNRHKIVGHGAASMFGALTPFCSCSSIPIFLSFIEIGVPLGVTFSFLVTSPILNEYLFVLMLGYFGWKIAVAYALSGIVIGIVSGLIIGKLGLEKHLETDLIAPESTFEDVLFETFGSRVKYGVNEGVSIVSKIWKWVLIGIAIGAVIHNYVPTQTVQQIATIGGIFSVPLAVFLGVPMYGGCAAIVPVAVVLFQKGTPLGTALAFMMAVSALSLPEAIILRRAMNIRLIAIFFFIVFVAIIFTGYMFNILAVLL